ncbi:YbgA family protein [Macrococcus carouselicus]|uniref:DUF1722 domain-containing protein n=1 Tax=Macrococcus carouselicus TaxID=69969 RepID=A0A9Q8CIV8_9STAP|nr:YbgA family protein [Macrococcus carouselicus]TDM02257.1 DUF1722 domain-containing protein [Macrococcus carouselicus]
MDNQKEQKKAVEKRWREEKYKVMYHSQHHYNHIRQLMKEPLTDIRILDAEINSAYTLTPTRGSMINTFQHIWGYFKKKATSQEKAHFMNLLDDLPATAERIISYLYELAIQYDVQYLKDSSILNDSR